MWSKRWRILHVTAWGDGEQAVLEYLARYCLSYRSHQCPHRRFYTTTKQSPSNTRNARPGRSRTCRLSGDEFMRRFLQHVLPRGFHKVRYFGLWHPRQRHNRRSGPADVATAGTTEARPAVGFRWPAARRPPTLRQPHQSELVGLSALSGAADLHPHALAAAGYGTHDPAYDICVETVRSCYRACSGARHGD